MNLKLNFSFLCKCAADASSNVNINMFGFIGDDGKGRSLGWRESKKKEAFDSSEKTTSSIFISLCKGNKSDISFSGSRSKFDLC